jgi:hypothetical protein
MQIELTREFDSIEGEGILASQLYTCTLCFTLEVDLGTMGDEPDAQVIGIDCEKCELWYAGSTESFDLLQSAYDPHILADESTNGHRLQTLALIAEQAVIADAHGRVAYADLVAEAVAKCRDKLADVA